MFSIKILAMLALIPLISLALTFDILPADAQRTQICIDKVWLESTKGRIACVTPTTAEKLVERGWGTLLDVDALKEKPMEEKPLPTIPTITKAGTIDIATLYDDGATNTWNIIAAAIGNLLDFSEESAQ